MSIFTEETQKLILAELKETTALTKIIAEGWKIDSWAAVRELVRSGAGKKYFPVGTEFNVTTQSYGTLVWQVVAHNLHKNPNDLTAPTMTLAMRDCIYGRAFDESELLWVNTTDSELPAGTYHFTAYKSDYGQDTLEDGTFQFTTTKAIPVNGGFWHSTMGQWRESYSVEKITSGTFTTFDADLNTIESGLSCTLGSEGTDLGTFSVAQATMNVLIGKANSTQRNGYGSNNYKESNIRQWLNASTTNWWTKQTLFDRPIGYNSKLGFFGDVDPEFAAIIGETDITVARNTVYEYDGTLGGSYTLRDKMFLLSMTELGFGNNSGIAENSTLEYYDGATQTDRIKYDYSSTTSARCWWLRSPNPWFARGARCVNTSGALSSDNAYYGFGAVAACSIY